MLKKLIAFLLFTLVPLLALAEQYQAPMTNTHWQVVETPLKCTLSQPIPDYGEANFSQQTGSNLTLTFITRNQPATQSNVQFEIVQAPWQNNNTKEALISVPTTANQKKFSVSGMPAQQALAKLQEGQFPAITYRSQNSEQPVTAVISTIHFSESYPAFQQCIDNLFPYTFKQMEDTTIHFSREKSALSIKAKEKLKNLADYIKLDKKIKLIKIGGHTDNHGYRRVNRPLSQERADAVKNFLVKECKVPENLITTASYMDHRPVASDKTAKGRALNRRAEIKLIR